MNLFSLTLTEIKKTRHSKILVLLFIPLVILWIPNIVNADMSLSPVMEGITPENNFFIQSFMGFAWFIFPASIIVCTVLLQQSERTNKGILKMLALPVRPGLLCLAKFLVLVLLSFIQIAAMTGLYFLCARIASAYVDYDLMVQAEQVLKLSGTLLLSSLPTMALYWMMAVCLTTPVFSIGLGLGTMVPSVLMINAKIWFLYPPCYPFYVVMTNYLKLSTDPGRKLDLIPWIPAGAALSILCLLIACLAFGHAERK